MGIFDERSDSHSLYDPAPTTVTSAHARRMEEERMAASRRAIKARQERDAQREADREAARQERGKAELAAMEADAKQTWLRGGGTESGFKQAWPKIKEDILSKLAAQRAAGGPDPAVARETERLRGTGRYQT